MKSYRIIFLYFTLIMPHVTAAQDISVIADYPKVVSAGEQFSVSWTINTGDGDFTAPSFDGFYKVMGPQTSYSSSTQIINGKVTRETTYSYVYYLQALKEGNYIIPPAVVTIRNRTYRSDSLRISVTGDASGMQGVQTDSDDTRQENDIRPDGGDIFLNILLDRREVFQGDHIIATVKLYTSVDISGISEIRFPSFNGFVKTDLETPQLTSLKRETINGVTYGTGIIQQFLLYPQVSGDIDIDPVRISVLTRQKTGRSDPFFGDFFSTYTTVPRAVESKPVKVRVNPLPSPKPDDFSGIVGKMEINALLDKDSVNVNDAVNLKILLSGRGNLRLARLPDLRLSPDIEVYDPKITDQLTNSVNGTSGQKSFEFLLIPRHNGDFRIPPLTMSYFNPSNRQYERLSTGELSFHARKVSGESSGITIYGGVSKEDVKYLGKDIRFIRTNPGKFVRTGNILTSRRAYYSVFAITSFVFLVVLFIRREQIKRNSDLVAVRNRKAARVAGRRLKNASSFLKQESKDRFYEEILKSLWGYISDKMGIPLSELTRNNAFTALKNRGIDDDTISSLMKVLDTCEFARYAPSPSESEAEHIFEEASRFIKRVENLLV